MEEILNQLLKVNQELIHKNITSTLEAAIADLLKRFFLDKIVMVKFIESQLDSSKLPAYTTTGRLKHVSLGLGSLTLYERTGYFPNDACYDLSKIKSIKIIEEK